MVTDTLIDALSFVAAYAPQQLLREIEDGTMAPHHLTYAAEAAGQIDSPDEVRSALVPLLQHSSPVVVEGAIYGLSLHIDDKTRDIMIRLSDSHPNDTIRRIAREALDTLVVQIRSLRWFGAPHLIVLYT